jgi:hypothetical protein
LRLYAIRAPTMLRPRTRSSTADINARTPSGGRESGSTRCLGGRVLSGTPTL